MTSSLKWAIVLFSVFVLFSLPVAFGIFTGLDQSATVFLQGLFSAALDTPLSLFSLLGSFEVTTLILIFVLARLGLKNSLIVLTVFLLGIGLELLGKIFLSHPGPPTAFFRYSLDIIFPSAYVQTGNSFPSGHSYRTAFLTYLLTYLLQTDKKLKQNIKKWLSTSLPLILLTMFISRISLGEHWTTDVIGGALLGFSLASFSIYLLGSGLLQSNRVK